MVEISKNPSYDKIQKLIHRFDKISGAFVFKDPSTKKEKFLSYNAELYGILQIFLFASTFYIKRSELISIILSFSLFMSLIILPIQIKKTHFNKNMSKGLFEWCKSLYNIEKNFDTVPFQEIARTKLMKIQKFTERIIVWFKNIIQVESFIVIIIAPLISLFIPNITSKFTPPLPFYLPFENQHNWTIFILTVVIQFIFVIYTVAIGLFVYNFLFCIVFHIIGYLDIIQEIVETVFKEQIVAKVKDFEDAKPTVSKGTLKIETLMEINNSIEAKDKDELEFTKWMQILCDMITDVNNQINSLKLLYANFFLLTEIQSLGSLFLCGFVFIVIKQQYYLAVSVTIVVLFYFICYINEFILEKFENIESGLYDIPWYYLSVKEQRMLLIALNCSRIQKGFTAAGIHELTLERFYAVIKAGYSNFVALKDLCT